MSNLISLRVDGGRTGALIIDLGEGERILAVDRGGGAGERESTVTVRPEWIKLTAGEVGARDRASLIGGTVADVVYLGSVTQLIVELRTGERLTVHRLNDDDGRWRRRVGDPVTLQWAAEHSFVIGTGRPADSEAGT